jgi:hypothetical protein
MDGHAKIARPQRCRQAAASATDGLTGVIYFNLIPKGRCSLSFGVSIRDGNHRQHAQRNPAWLTVSHNLFSLAWLSAFRRRPALIDEALRP